MNRVQTVREVKSGGKIGRRLLPAALVTFLHSDSTGAPLRWVASPSGPIGPSLTFTPASAQCGNIRLFRPNPDVACSLNDVHEAPAAAPHFDSSGLHCVGLSLVWPRPSQQDRHPHRDLSRLSVSGRRRVGSRAKKTRGCQGTQEWFHRTGFAFQAASSVFKNGPPLPQTFPPPPAPPSPVECWT